ncbi:uncharacterized protein LOC126994464 [Eriocheir sinensis]|uniref:uncharacterized protein LOC126994464 n=1 Tax=Eriocheir sinensis TaxID=95602 RepID=UPI0021C8547F|nr:uncharacterized protein LOC126994464 [Eriocheir sinensis]
MEALQGGGDPVARSSGGGVPWRRRAVEHHHHGGRMTEARAAAVFTQSLDYDTCVNSAWLDEERTQCYTFVVKKDAARWLVVLLTVLVVCGIDIAIKSLSKCKYSWLQMCILAAAAGPGLGQ